MTVSKKTVLYTALLVLALLAVLALLWRLATCDCPVLWE
jgi:hypothetical protein